MVQNLLESGALSFIGARFLLVQHLFKKLHNFLLVTVFDKMTKTTLLLVLNFLLVLNLFKMVQFLVGARFVV